MGLTIAGLIVQMGLPLASKFIAMWAAKEPGNVALQEYAAFLSSPDLAKTPDEAIAEAAKKAGVNLVQ